MTPTNPIRSVRSGIIPVTNQKMMKKGSIKHVTNAPTIKNIVKNANNLVFR